MVLILAVVEDGIKKMATVKTIGLSFFAVLISGLVFISGASYTDSNTYYCKIVMSDGGQIYG